MAKRSRDSGRRWENIVKHLKAILICAAMAQTVPGTLYATELTIATVNNGHMIEMQMLTGYFIEENPDVSINWVTLEEGTLRSRISRDIATDGGQYDVMTIGMYEAPIWGERGWLEPLDFAEAYDVDDILPAIRDGLSHNGTLYAAPFYGESSMVMYRADLVQQTGLRIDDRSTWSDIREVAAAIHDPAQGVHGVCLRGKPGWGDNMALITTIANSFGAQWFDMNWKPALNSAQWNDAVQFYVDLLRDYGPPGADKMSFNEILSLFNQGSCGIWIDATIAASFVSDSSQSRVAQQVAFAQAPGQTTRKGANWLWAWALAIPAGSNNPETAQRFVEWATSKDYIEFVGNRNGWGAVPTGTRQSTYNNPDFQQAATFAQAELQAITSANPSDATDSPSPYTGIQFAAIPEFQDIGTQVAELVAASLRGELSVDDAMTQSQTLADEAMDNAGYY